MTGLVRKSAGALASLSVLGARGLQILRRPTGLAEALRAGNVDAAEALLARGADPDEADPVFGTPLLALLDPYWFVIEECEPDRRPGFGEIIPRFSRPADVLPPKNFIRRLLELGADPNQLHVHVPRYDVEAFVGEGPFGLLPIDVIEPDNGAFVADLLDAGMDPNRHCLFHPLVEVCARTRASETVSETAKLLLEAGADVDGRGTRAFESVPLWRTETEAVDFYNAQVTPLGVAAVRDAIDLVELLLAHGADPDRPSAELRSLSPATPLERAIERQNWSPALALLAYGADRTAARALCREFFDELDDGSSEFAEVARQLI